MKKKIIISAIVALTLALLVAVGGTMAYLVANTAAVENVFTPSNIDVLLTETDEDRSFKMVPGNTISKDPEIEVRNDIKCYVFVKIDESTNFDEYLEYAIADGWTLYDPTTKTTNATITTSDEDSYIIYRIVEAGQANAKFAVLKNDEIKVKESVTKEMMNSLFVDTTAYPTLTFKAAAVQYDNLTEVANAYEQINWNDVASTVVLNPNS